MVFVHQFVNQEHLFIVNLSCAAVTAMMGSTTFPLRCGKHSDALYTSVL